eukprot:38457-Chlamydomonas_euryale.AAC.13
MAASQRGVRARRTWRIVCSAWSTISLTPSQPPSTCPAASSDSGVRRPSMYGVTCCATFDPAAPGRLASSAQKSTSSSGVRMLCARAARRSGKATCRSQDFGYAGRAGKGACKDGEQAGQGWHQANRQRCLEASDQAEVLLVGAWNAFPPLPSRGKTGC